MINPAIYLKISDYCATAERSPAAVKTKLNKLKVNSADFGEYLDQLKKEKFLSEDRFAKGFVEAHLRKKWGKVKMMHALSQKGISSASSQKYLDEINISDYKEQMQVLADKKWRLLKDTDLKKKKNKLIRFLLGKGFNMGDIMNTVKKF